MSFLSPEQPGGELPEYTRLTPEQLEQEAAAFIAQYSFISPQEAQYHFELIRSSDPQMDGLTYEQWLVTQFQECDTDIQASAAQYKRVFKKATGEENAELVDNAAGFLYARKSRVWQTFLERTAAIRANRKYIDTSFFGEEKVNSLGRYKKIFLDKIVKVVESGAQVPPEVSRFVQHAKAACIDALENMDCVDISLIANSSGGASMIRLESTYTEDVYSGKPPSRFEFFMTRQEDIGETLEIIKNEPVLLATLLQNSAIDSMAGRMVSIAGGLRQKNREFMKVVDLHAAVILSSIQPLVAKKFFSLLYKHFHNPKELNSLFLKQNQGKKGQSLVQSKPEDGKQGMYIVPAGLQGEVDNEIQLEVGLESDGRFLPRNTIYLTEQGDVYVMGARGERIELKKLVPQLPYYEPLKCITEPVNLPDTSQTVAITGIPLSKNIRKEIAAYRQAVENRLESVETIDDFFKMVPVVYETRVLGSPVWAVEDRTHVPYSPQ